VIPQSIGHPDRHLEVAHLLGSQSRYFDAVAKGDSGRRVQVSVFRPLLLSLVQYAQLDVFETIRFD